MISSWSVQAVAGMQKASVVDLTGELASAAAALAHARKLAMADAIILATAQQFKATLWTQDADFEHFADVKFKPKPK